jgi:hypothetical protein
MLSDWVSFLAYPNLFGIKGFVVVEIFWSSEVLKGTVMFGTDYKFTDLGEHPFERDSESIQAPLLTFEAEKNKKRCIKS